MDFRGFKDAYDNIIYTVDVVCARRDNSSL